MLAELFHDRPLSILLHGLVLAQSPSLLYELTARQLYTYYKADIYAYVMVMQNINRELCRRLRRADDRVAQLQMLHASQ